MDKKSDQKPNSQRIETEFAVYFKGKNKVFLNKEILKISKEGVKIPESGFLIYENGQVTFKFGEATIFSKPISSIESVSFLHNIEMNIRLEGEIYPFSTAMYKLGKPQIIGLLLTIFSVFLFMGKEAVGGRDKIETWKVIFDNHDVAVKKHRISGLLTLLKILVTFVIITGIIRLISELFN